ncbi:MAG: Rossmann fold domain-containing protein [Novosphingobium sp.]|uniref:Rossmann fold domain-containing protein n=1 Tax=Novosphingobium sp. TaxID=1874826 RepID=UPI0032B870E9
MRRLDVSGLPDDPLAAAARFYATVATILVPAATEEDIVVVFPAADHTHRAWRLAAVQSLARSHAPARVNAVAGGDAPAITAALAFLKGAQGLTGQYLQLDGTGAAPVVTSAA